MFRVVLFIYLFYFIHLYVCDEAFVQFTLLTSFTAYIALSVDKCLVYLACYLKCALSLGPLCY